ncbi:Maltose permease MAL61 [Cyphellophora attinorum]|uniref:Maltose permease MAL61 n=1 Tax=Cyphellophora attinorum TaxID=1664694 RepID=A0A0N0NRG9_9EURO|nr:Maltose permease MAL61 [Phialophora attinorum]KPI45071.1 Maltose permease MAL61 [Phialophora attinorum]
MTVTSVPSGIPKEMRLIEAVKLYPKITRYTFFIMSAIVLYGFDLVIVGAITAVPGFQKDFGQLHDDKHIIPASWLSLWQALGPFGALVGAMLAGWVQDRVGRKMCLAGASFLSAVSVAVLFVSNRPAAIDTRRAVFLVGKIVQGVAVGMINIQAITYVSETIPTCLRGPALALFPAFTLLGQLIGSVVVFLVSDLENESSYLIAFATMWPFSVGPFVLALLMPESPAYLIRRKRMDDARSSIRRLFAPKVDPEEVFEKTRLSIEVEERLARQVTYMDCIKPAHRRRTWIVVFAAMITSIIGLPLLSTASYFLQVVGMSSFNSLLFLIVGIILGLIANAVSVWILSRVGRRRLTIYTLIIGGMLWGGMGICGFWDGVITVWYTAISCMIIVIIVGVGAWPASFAIRSEASSLRLRSKTQGLAGLFDHLSTIVLNLILPYIYNPDQGNLKAKTGFVFAGLCLVGAAVTFYDVPEMKGRTVLEIDAMFRLGLKTREFRNWRGTTEEIEAAVREVEGDDAMELLRAREGSKATSAELPARSSES